jgi:hypothetical protein
MMDSAPLSRRKDKAMYFDLDDWIGPALAVACVALIVLLVWAAIEDERKWDSFKDENHCKQVAHIKGDVFNTFGTDMKGNMTIGVGSTPAKNGWLCDDGMTYYR